jgi:hypothetical protein
MVASVQPHASGDRVARLLWLAEFAAFTTARLPYDVSRLIDDIQTLRPVYSPAFSLALWPNLDLREAIHQQRGTLGQRPEHPKIGRFLFGMIVMA